MDNWKDPHPPSRHCMCPSCIPSFDDRFQPPNLPWLIRQGVPERSRTHRKESEVTKQQAEGMDSMMGKLS